jgi:hypothetical protein
MFRVNLQVLYKIACLRVFIIKMHKSFSSIPFTISVGLIITISGLALASNFKRTKDQKLQPPQTGTQELPTPSQSNP